MTQLRELSWPSEVVDEEFHGKKGPKSDLIADEVLGVSWNDVILVDDSKKGITFFFSLWPSFLTPLRQL